MAEFMEVAKQYRRLCKRNGCSKCVVSAAAKEYGSSCSMWVLTNPEAAESVIMEWAAEHPEPVYPTWKQWHAKMFPNHSRFSHGNIKPCVFMDADTAKCDQFFGRCFKCAEQRIPAEIAEKLGIKPGKEWAE